MKVLLLNGSQQNHSTSETACKIIADELTNQNHDVQSINLRDIPIASCLGCFGCWIKTPGICVINDAGRDIAKAVVQSDIVITLSPITFGGYSYELKKALDRLIPIISPYFKKIKGEIHHKPRYKRYPGCLTIGILSEKDAEKAEIFTNLVARNAVNMHSAVYLSGILYEYQSSEEIGHELNKLLREMGVIK
ncbi:MAG: flavodoxin family protein [Thermincolia bacterium]